MTTADTEFFRAFAGRVRQQLASPEGSPTMETTATAETTKTAVPATFLAAPDAPCEAYTWCTAAGVHVDHMSRWVSLPTDSSVPPILNAHLYTDRPTGIPELNFDPGHDDWREYTSGDQLRAEVAKVRAHLARLDAFADQYDALREDGGQTPTELQGAPAEPRIGTAVPDDDAPQVTLTGAAGHLLRAYVYQPDEGAAGGVEKPTICVYSDGGADAELDLNGARKFRADLAAFLPRLDVMISALAGGEAASPAPAPSGKTWAITTATNGTAVSGYLPAWADEDPSCTDLPDKDLSRKLGDVAHCKSYPGQQVTLNVPDCEGGRQVIEEEVFRLEMWCRPYSTRPGHRMPFGVVTVTDDQMIDDVDPDGFRDLAAKLRAQAAILDQAAADLTAAREDWAANGGNH